jgi:transposase InsO family protein
MSAKSNHTHEIFQINHTLDHCSYGFLIVVDAHSKWPETIPTKPTNSTATIKILREIFSRFGLPSILVSDNGSNFHSSEFEDFLKANGIHHKYSAPCHPATNGQAERVVQIMKQSFRAMENEPSDITLKLNRFLMQYRITSHTTTKRSPAEFMFGRKICSRLRSNIQ